MDFETMVMVEDRKLGGDWSLYTFQWLGFAAAAR
jgi:hypothetical protein